MPNRNELINLNGGLTIVPCHGFEKIGGEVRRLIQEIEAKMVKEGKITEAATIDLVEPEWCTRASGEPYLKLGKDHIGGHDCVIISSGPATHVKLSELNWLLSYTAGRRAQRITIVFGYFPESRSDKDEGKKELALPAMEMAWWNGASNGKLDRVIACDLHSPQLVMAGFPGVITEVSMARKVLLKAVTDAVTEGFKKIVIHFPDVTAGKRFETAFDKVKEAVPGIEMYWTEGPKKRKDSSECKIGPIIGDIEKLEGALAIIMDDEAATLSTTEQWAKVLINNHRVVKVWGSVVHGVFCGEGPNRLAAPDCPIERQYCTDTIPFYDRQLLNPLLASGKIRVICWHEDLADIIHRHHWNRSIRDIR